MTKPKSHKKKKQPVTVQTVAPPLRPDINTVMDPRIPHQGQRQDEIWVNNGMEGENWQAPDTTDTPDLVMTQIEETITKAAAPKGKCGEDFRSEKSLWDCDERVVNHPNVGPLQNGIPVGSFRPDDGAVGKDPITRMRNRRLVLLNFSPSTWNK
ncbi:unnamed protein product, partial [Penicillium bialowiezense]